MVINKLERLDLYAQLLAAAKKQLEYCRNADWEQEEVQKQVSELIEQRQTLIEQIKALGQEPLSREERRIVEEILAANEQSAEIMARFKDQFARKLKQVRKGMRTAKAYYPATVQTEGYFIDRRE